MYRIKILLAAIALLAISMMYVSCGGGQNGVSGSLSSGSGQPASQMGLPALDELPEVSHAVSQLGPGWFPVDVTEQGVTVGRSTLGTVINEAGGKRITAVDSPAWAMFAVRGFDHDSSPTALRVESDAPADSYYVGETSYETGRWIFHGPFGGDSETEYEAAGSQYDPDNHVSNTGSHYIAIVATPGVSMLVTGMELGVDGGDDSPLSGLGFEAYDGDAGIVLTWTAAAGSDNPDYAGAFVERTIWPDFDYVDVGGPQFEQYFLDSAVTVGTKYRYRIRHEDVSGNSSHSHSTVAVHAGGDTPPIAILDIPAGPLYGRQTVDFDMSPSFDPDGDAITQYEIQFGFPGFNNGILPIVTASSSVDVELQPGTYIIRISVTANGQTGSSIWKLKVFPTWQTDPLLVSPGQKGEWAMQKNRTIYFPPGNEMLTFHNAPLLPGIGLHIQHADGSSSRKVLPYKFLGADWISEPVIWQDKAFIAVRDNSEFHLAYYDGSEFHWSDSFIYGGGGGYEQGDLVVDGDGRLRLCYLWEIAPGDWRIDAQDVVSGASIPVSPVGNSSGWFDVEWNSFHGTFDTIYPMVGSSHFQRLDPVAGPVDIETVIAVAPSFADLEIDQATGQASVLERIGALQLYIPYDDGAAMFAAPEVVDNAANNTEFADLLFLGSEATVFFGLDGLPSKLYRHNGGAWDAVTADWTPQSGEHCSMAAWPDGSVFIVDGGSNFEMFMAQVASDDSTSLLGSVLSGTYQGRDLNAVAGNDGIHAYWVVGDSGVHFIADADGTNWTVAPDEGQAWACELMSDRDGDVFLSHSWGANHELHSWNGANWLFESSSDTWNAARPWFVAQDNAFGGQWWAHDHSVAPARLRRMHDDDGLALLPDSIELDYPNVFEGTALITQGGYQSYVLTGSGSVHESSVGFLDSDTGSYSEVIKGFSLPSELNWTDGRRLDASVYFDDPGFPAEVYYASFQFFGLGVTRVQAISALGDVSLLGVEPFESFLTAENGPEGLTTVSCAQAWCNTAVSISDQFHGGWHQMEWSNYGNFENIPSPDIDWSMSSMHELVVGNDGRWHMLYRDMNDGGIYVISTS